VNGSLNWLTAPGWHPTVPVWLLFVGFVLALPLTAAMLHRQALMPTASLLPAPLPGRRAVDVGAIEAPAVLPLETLPETPLADERAPSTR
jgi:hypothetical protein